MKAFLFVCLAVVGAASAGLLHHPVVIPGAVTHSSRVGGNFAYSTVEGAVVAAHPVVHHGVLGVHHGVVGLHHGLAGVHHAGLLHHGVAAYGLHHGLAYHPLAHHLAVHHG
ncbi:uncharacterized protein LOC124165841 [Ischnura elegans]|uniref:uncharacterized protein LOC124165841 n=1 Tax=Ischnura elegans TaxID=197161 RepID=UPI001ED8B1C9|nr:uncharacterized protein LOC124165841 [Ischnura elegans]